MLIINTKYKFHDTSTNQIVANLLNTKINMKLWTSQHEKENQLFEGNQNNNANA